MDTKQKELNAKKEAPKLPFAIFVGSFIIAFVIFLFAMAVSAFFDDPPPANGHPGRAATIIGEAAIVIFVAGTIASIVTALGISLWRWRARRSTRSQA